jgi:hypothetical protein
VTAVEVVDGEARVRFDQFDAEAYELFLRCKALPESDLSFDWSTDTYTVTTAARFLPLLPGRPAPAAAVRTELAAHLFDYQAWIVGRALAARRFAIWADTGLGKTLMFLEWARQVAVDGPVLILAPQNLIGQHLETAQEFYGDSLQIEDLTARQDLDWWLTAPAGVAIANTEKLAAGELPLRRLHGLVLDESSILKTGGGTIKWNLIHCSRGIPFKLSCTATPAPNDTMEYASQAAFLERLRHEGEILWTWFSRDGRGTWRIKPHGQPAFYRFMASWSVYMRDPAAYGFASILDSLPDPVIHDYDIAITSAQRALADELLVNTGRGLFDERLGIRERLKLAQLARGFRTTPNGPVAVESRKPLKVADLAAAEREAGRPTIVWCNFNEEARLIAKLLHNTPGLAMLHGDTPTAERAETIDAFRHGSGVDVLVTKAQLVGHGLNFQRCKAMVFSGIDDSFERFYQAVRRAYRFGQTDVVHVHRPVVPELEGLQLTNLDQKDARFMADVATMEAHYLAATQELIA